MICAPLPFSPQPTAFSLLRRNRDDDALALLRRRHVHLAHVFQQADDLLDHAVPFVDVGDFAAAEHDRHHHLVLVLEEAASLVHFEPNIVVARFRTDADFLDLAVVDVGLVFLFFLFLLVF